MVKNLYSTKDWLAVEKVLDNGIILTQNKEYIKIIKIIPINFNLKTELERISILKSYKEFLKICNFDIQIIIQSNKQDLSSIISKVKNQEKEKSKGIQKISDEYIKFLNNVNLNRKSACKNYYIIIKENNSDEKLVFDQINEKYIKVKEALTKCGNKVFNLEKQEIIEILFSFFNVRMNLLKNRKE